jgi:hypothetical protein
VHREIYIQRFSSPVRWSHASCKESKN